MYYAWAIITGLQNNYNRRQERAVTPTDVSQRLVMNYNYELPLGRGKHFGSHWNRALDIVAGRWQFNGITTFQTGNPLYIRLSDPNVFGGTRPNNNGASALLSGSERSVSRGFDTSVFSPPAAFSLGSTGRALPDVRSPGTNNFDLSLFKIVSIRERLKLQIRAEAFNAFNHPRFTLANGTVATTSFGNALFGQYTTAADPRLAQLTLKLRF